MNKRFRFILAFCLILGITSVAYAEDVMEKLSESGTISKVYEQDFENWTGSDGKINLPDVASVEGEDPSQGKYVSLKIGPSYSDGTVELNVMLSDAIVGDAIYKIKYKFSDTGDHRKILGNFRDSSNNGHEMYFFQADKSGSILQMPEGKEVMKYDTDTWYEFVYVFNYTNKSIDAYINGTKVLDGIPFQNADFMNIKRFWLVKLWDPGVYGEVKIDDVGLYNYAPYPEASLSEKTISYDADEIVVNFSAPVTAKSANGAISLKTKDSDDVLCSGELSADGTKYVFTLGEVLEAKGEYVVEFADGICSENKSPMLTDKIEFSVLPNAVNYINFQTGGNDITTLDGMAGKKVIAYTRTECEAERDVTLILGLYSDNRLVDIISKTKKLGFDKLINIGLTIPNDGKKYELRAFAWDTLDSQNASLEQVIIK